MMTHHPLAKVARDARRSRAHWKRTSDTSLDQRIEDVVRHFGPDRDVAKISNADLLAYVAALETHPGRKPGSRLSPKTVNRYLAVVSGILDYAVLVGLREAMPVIPWQVEPPGRLGLFTEAQEASLCSSMPEPYGLILRVLCATGLRAGELWHLRPDDIEAEWLRLYDTKNGTNASVPIDPSLSGPLRELVKAGSLPTHAQFYRTLKTACRSLGYPETLNVHSARHTTATRLALRQTGALVQRYMRHKSYKTTEKYIHLSDSDLLAASRSLHNAGSV